MVKLGILYRLTVSILFIIAILNEFRFKDFLGLMRAKLKVNAVAALIFQIFIVFF